jgi:hypothetical protein
MKKGKFNYIDIIIIIIIIGVIVAGIMYMSKDDDTEVVVSGKEHIIFIAEADGIDANTIKDLKVGDKLVALDSFQDAEITDIQVFDAEGVDVVDGEVITYSIAEKVRLVVKIEGNANKYGPYTEIGGQEIKAGSKYWIKTDTVQAYGYVVNIIED